MPKWQNTHFNSNLISKAKLSEDDPQLDIDSIHLYKFIISSTNTTLTLTSAPKILENYIISLTIERCSLGRLVKRVARNYNLYQGVIDFPQGFPVRHITGDVSRSKSVAMEKACWNSVIKLYKLKVLDDFLNPIYLQPSSERNLTLEPSIYKCVCKQIEFKSIKYYILKVPSLFKEIISLEGNNQLFINSLDFKYFDIANGNMIPNLGFVTTRQLSEDLKFSLYINGKETPILVKQARKSSNLPVQYISMCARFTRALLDNFNNFEPKFLILPLLSSGSTINYIDIELIHNFLNISLMGNNCKFIRDPIITDVNTESFNYSLEPKISLSEYSRSRYQMDQFNRHSNAELNFKSAMNTKKHDRCTLNQLSPTVICSIQNLKTSQLMPSIIHTIYHATLISGVKFLLDEPKINLYQLLIAFTDPKAQMNFNNLKLNQLGAAFISFATTLIVYCNYPKASESELHNRRIHVSRNYIILLSDYIYKLPSYINTTPQNSINSYCQLILNNTTNKHSRKPTQLFSEAILVRNIKAIVGACVSTQEIDKEELGFNIVRKLVYSTFTDYNSLKKVCKNELGNGDISGLKKHMDSVESIIGYKFTNKYLLIQSLTHKSYTGKLTNSYERLEFLGDKILEYMICQYLNNSYPELCPKNFGIIKQTCATNKVLFEFCIKSGLNQYIFSNNSMSRYLKECPNNAKDQQIIFKYNKICSDTVESLTGAMFIDSEFNNDITYRFVDKLLGPIINQYVTYEHSLKCIDRVASHLKLSKCKRCNIVLELVKNSGIVEIKSRTRYTVHGKVISESQCDYSAESNYKAAISFMNQININSRLVTELCDC